MPGQVPALLEVSPPGPQEWQAGPCLARLETQQRGRATHGLSRRAAPPPAPLRVPWAPLGTAPRRRMAPACAGPGSLAGAPSPQPESQPSLAGSASGARGAPSAPPASPAHSPRAAARAAAAPAAARPPPAVPWPGRLRSLSRSAPARSRPLAGLRSPRDRAARSRRPHPSRRPPRPALAAVRPAPGPRAPPPDRPAPRRQAPPPDRPRIAGAACPSPSRPRSQLGLCLGPPAPSARAAAQPGSPPNPAWSVGWDGAGALRAGSRRPSPRTRPRHGPHFHTARRDSSLGPRELPTLSHTQPVHAHLGTLTPPHTRTHARHAGLPTTVHTWHSPATAHTHRLHLLGLYQSSKLSPCR